MPVTEKTYPDWVQKFREKGTTIKKKGDAYYLYKRTSRRVSGKKYPQPVDTYIGVITPDGVVQAKRKIVNLSDITVYEYGFSKSVLQACPEDWKRAHADDWEQILCCVIMVNSPESYLAMERVVPNAKELHINTGAMNGSLNMAFRKKYGVLFSELHLLKSIYLLNIDGNRTLSRISPEQAKLLSRVHVNLEVD